MCVKLKTQKCEYVPRGSRGAFTRSAVCECFFFLLWREGLLCCRVAFSFVGVGAPLDTWYLLMPRFSTKLRTVSRKGEHCCGIVFYSWCPRNAGKLVTSCPLRCVDPSNTVGGRTSYVYPPPGIWTYNTYSCYVCGTRRKAHINAQLRADPRMHYLRRIISSPCWCCDTSTTQRG